MTASTTLSHGDLASRATAVYGPQWQSALARESGIALRTVQRWARDGIGKPATAEGIRRFLEERARQRVDAPPAEAQGSRDDAAYAEMRPRIEALVQAATAAGWHPAETLTAILACTVDLMRAGAGAPAVIHTLRETIDAVRANADR